MSEINNVWVVKQQTPEGGWVETHWFPMELVTKQNGDDIPEDKRFDIGEARAALIMEQMKAESPDRGLKRQKAHFSSAPRPDEPGVYITKTYNSWQ